MNKNYDAKNTLLKLKKNLIFIEGKFKKQYFLLENIPQEKLNQILMRNLYYFHMVVNKVKYNIREIVLSKKLLKNKKITKKLKKELRLGMKKKSYVALLLLQHLTGLLQKYSIDNFDFEIQTLLDNDEQKLLEKIPDEFKDSAKEEFHSLGRDYNLAREGIVVEPFFKAIIKALKKAVNFIKEKLEAAIKFVLNLINKIVAIFGAIFNALKKIFDMMIQIVQFLTKTMFDFLKLLWDLLKMLWNLITVIIPKMIAAIFSFFKYLFLKLQKIGPFTILVYFAFNLLVSKYWELLLSGIEIGGQEIPANIPDLMITFPAILMTSFAFWAKTKEVKELQDSILKFIIGAGRSSMKFIFVNFLGFPENDKFFTTRSGSPLVLIKLFFMVLIKNFSKIMIRTLLFAMVLKFGMSYFMENFSQFVPTFREIILFPIIVIRTIVMFVYNLIVNQMLGSE